MNDTEKRVLKTTNEITKIIENFSDKKKENLLQWTKSEYKNFMIISRLDFKKTINHILNSDLHEEDKVFFEYLKANIDCYGAIKSFHYSSIAILDSINKDIKKKD